MVILVDCFVLQIPYVFFLIYIFTYFLLLDTYSPRLLSATVKIISAVGSWLSLRNSLQHLTNLSAKLFGSRKVQNALDY